MTFDFARRGDPRGDPLGETHGDALGEAFGEALASSTQEMHSYETPSELQRALNAPPGPPALL